MTKPCAIAECPNQSMARPHILCLRHWDMLPSPRQAEFIEGIADSSDARYFQATGYVVGWLEGIADSSDARYFQATGYVVGWLEGYEAAKRGG